MLAQYKCLKCSFEWEEQTKSGSIETSHGPIACPNCSHIYLKWKNYDSVR